MKKLILCILLALFCITVDAQVKREGNTFKVEQTAKASDTKTKYTWEDKKAISTLSSLQRRVLAMYLELVRRLTKSTNTIYLRIFKPRLNKKWA